MYSCVILFSPALHFKPTTTGSVVLPGLPRVSTHIVGYANSHVAIHFRYLNMLDAQIGDIQNMEWGRIWNGVNFYFTS